MPSPAHTRILTTPQALSVPPGAPITYAAADDARHYLAAMRDRAYPQLGLFPDPLAPTQLALFGDSVSAEVDQ